MIRALIRYYSLPFASAQWLRVLFAIVGIALGVAVYTAMRSSNEAILYGFQSSLQRSFGVSDLSLASPLGKLSDSLLPLAQQVPGVELAVPRSEKTAQLFLDKQPLGTARVLGIDVVQQPKLRYVTGENFGSLGTAEFLELLQYKAAFASPELARASERGKLSVVVEGVRVPLPKLLPFESLEVSSFIAMDISLYQLLFREIGVVDAIDVVVSPGESAVVEARLGQALASEAVIKRKEDVYGQLKQTTEAFRLNLNFLAAISLVVALLLIYHVTSYLTLSRRRDLSQLRAIGAAPKKLFHLLIGEAFLLGIIGGALGIALGKVLSLFTDQAVETTLNQLYASSSLVHSGFTVRLMAEGLFLALVTAVIGAWPSAREVYHSSFQEGLSEHRFERVFRGRLNLLAVIGSASLLLGVALSQRSLLELDLRLGFIPPALITLGILVLTPKLLYLLCWFGKSSSFSQRHPSFLLAFDHLFSSLRRATAASASVALALGMFLGVAIMINSFRGTVEAWIGTITRPDIFLSLPSTAANRATDSLPQELLQWIRTHSAVTALGISASRESEYAGRSILIRGGSLEQVLRRESVVFIERAPDLIPEEIDWSRSAFISEPFSHRFGKTVGNSVVLQTGAGAREFQILGVYQDFSSELGAIDLSFETYAEIVESEAVQGVALFLSEGYGTSQFIREVKEAFPALLIDVRDNVTLRQEVLRVFDRTFHVTYVLQAISIGIALVVLLNSFMMLIVERAREIQTLRALGVARSRVRHLLALEGSLLMGMSLAVALALGGSLSVLLVFVINKHFFGWSIHYLLPIGEIVSVLLLSLVLALAVSYLLSRFFLEKLTQEGLRYE